MDVYSLTDSEGIEHSFVVGNSEDVYLVAGELFPTEYAPLITFVGPFVF